MPNVRIALVGSGDGASFEAAHNIVVRAGIELNWVVFVDRQCGLAVRAQSLRVPLYSKTMPSNKVLSQAISAECEIQDVAAVLLLFSRLVTEELFARFWTCNIHPSLLPAFPGMGALRAAFEHGVRVFGATLHEVDAGVDTGPILCQRWVAAPPGSGLEFFQRQSHLQKVYLMLYFVELVLSAGNREGGSRQIPEQQPDSVLDAFSCPSLTVPELLQGYFEYAETLKS